MKSAHGLITQGELFFGNAERKQFNTIQLETMLPESVENPHILLYKLLYEEQCKITEATIQAQEKERIELGRELHENITQILSTTKLYIDMAASDEGMREELLQKGYTNISRAIEEIRNLYKSLIPASLDDIGLREALLDMVENLPEKGQLKVSLKCLNLHTTVISDSIKLMAFRFVQEQLQNILRHSGATKAEIKLSISKKMLNIIVTDDGIGFDSRKMIRGIGLSCISSRARLHKGKAEIISAPDGGCTLNVFIPL
jgi:two-component system sensor histidine kinase UhpB